MKFAFCLVKYFPYGGLQRDFLNIARACISKGHRVDAFATAWEGRKPTDFSVSILPCRGFTNHTRRESFIASFHNTIGRASYDAVVGFNKMPGLDVYYAADPCYADKVARSGRLYRLTSRCRTYLKLERAVFAPSSATRILAICERQTRLFRQYYQTPQERFFLLPPGITRDRVISRAGNTARGAICRELQLDSGHRLVLMVGTGFKRKGVDRAIRGLASLPNGLRCRTELLVLGKNKFGPYQRLAQRLKVGNQVHFLGGRDDVPQFMAAADLLLHPALMENTGTVLIEAMAAGLPVLATEVCGYSDHIQEAQAGKVITDPFEQVNLNRLLEEMLQSDHREQWSRNGKAYVAQNDVFSLPQKAADIIEQVAAC